jgi:hypothetical protein
MSFCPPVFEEMMIVRAFESDSGLDVSHSDRIADGTLFIFDSSERLIQVVQVAKNEMGIEKALPLPAGVKEGDEIYISAWGNVNDNMEARSDYQLGEPMSAQFLTLRPDVDHNGYELPPGGELFFGLHKMVVGHADGDDTAIQIPGRRSTDPDIVRITHTIPISQVDARLAVTVIGLEERDADLYHFLMEGRNNVYAFDGTVLGGVDPRQIYGHGVFNGAGQLVFREPYRFIPSVDPNNVTLENSIKVHLMQSDENSSAPPINITEEVSNKEPIVLMKGKTTNVLILFDNGDVSMQVVITEWNEIHQWTII